PAVVRWAGFLGGALLPARMQREREVAVRQGALVDLAQYEFRLVALERHPGPNDVADRGTVEVLRNGTPYTTLHPEKRAYASGGQVMTEAAIDKGVTRDLFVALGAPLGDDAWALRMQIKPFVRWIWAGALLLMLGGFVTAADRRSRVSRRLSSRPDASGPEVTESTP